MQIENIIKTSDQTYEGNSLSDAQIILADPSFTGVKGTNNIINDIVRWSRGEISLSSFIGSNDGQFYYVGGGDSMNHVMKGNIGLFISGGQNIHGNKIVISNINSKGNNVGISTLTPIEPDPLLKKGLDSNSLLIAASSNIHLVNSNSRIMEANSENGESNRIKLIGTNTNIAIL